MGPDIGQAPAQGWPCLALVWPRGWLPLVPPLALGSLRKNKTLGFCPVQFREYLLYNFSEIQKQQKTGTGASALVNWLVPEKC